MNKYYIGAAIAAVWLYSKYKAHSVPAPRGDVPQGTGDSIGGTAPQVNGNPLKNLNLNQQFKVGNVDGIVKPAPMTGGIFDGVHYGQGFSMPYMSETYTTATGAMGGLYK